jgi:Mor family transcriptional regulator
MKQSLKPKRDAAVILAYQNGSLIADMVKTFAISRQRIYAILARGGVQANRIDKE